MALVQEAAEELLEQDWMSQGKGWQQLCFDTLYVPYRVNSKLPVTHMMTRGQSMQICAT